MEADDDPYYQEGLARGRLAGFYECLSLGFGHGQQLAHQVGFHLALAEAASAIIEAEGSTEARPPSESERKIGGAARALADKAKGFPLDNPSAPKKEGEVDNDVEKNEAAGYDLVGHLQAVSSSSKTLMSMAASGGAATELLRFTQPSQLSSFADPLAVAAAGARAAAGAAGAAQ